MENAFITIYIKKSPVETAKNLMNLATESNIGDLAALEFIVGALVSKGDISTGAVCPFQFSQSCLSLLKASIYVIIIFLFCMKRYTCS